MNQKETQAGSDSLSLGALYLERQGLKRFAGAKGGRGTPRR